MTEWTRAELETAHPDGTVRIQTDDVLRTMTTAEWDAWIEGQVGTPKLTEEE